MTISTGVRLFGVFTLFGAVAALGNLTPASPQERTPYFGRMRSRGVTGLGEMLGFSAPQWNKLRIAMREMHIQREAILANNSLTPKQKSARMGAIHAKMERKFNAILTPTQRKRHQNLIEQFHQQRRDREILNAI